MTTEQERRKAQMAAAASRRLGTRRPASRLDSDPVQAGTDHPRPEPRAVPAAHPLDGRGRDRAGRATGGPGRRGPAMIRVTTENPDEVIKQLRRDREQ